MGILFVFLFLLIHRCLGILDGMSDSDVGAVRLRLEEEKEKRLLLENDVEILMLKVANLTKTVEQIRNVQQPISTRNIAFMAYLSGALTHLVKNQKVIFDRIVTNEGNGYSAITGIFTVPTTGTYFFTWTIGHMKNIASPDTDLVTGIAVNGQYKVHESNNIAAGFQMGGNTAIIHLDVSDNVWIGIQHGNGLFSDASNGWYYTAFSGFMLHS